MDDKTQQALTILANKFGTTAEHLWGALLRQAPIAGAMDIFSLGMVIVAAAMWFKFVKRKTTAPPVTDNDKYPRADWDDEEYIIMAYASVCLLFFTCWLLVVVRLKNVVAALLNPEYWALMQILK